MRNGNNKKNKKNKEVTKVLILPMRNGNEMRRKNIFENIKIVLILPMRNGNSLVNTNQYLFLFVLILPMRNGNGLCCEKAEGDGNLFLSYL